MAGMVLMLSASSALAQLKPEAAPSDLAQLKPKAAPSAPTPWKFEIAPEYFYWQEQVDGVKVLDESGLRYGLELSYKEPRNKGWVSAGRFKLYYGAVDYDGQTMGGTPVKTTTDYYGGLLEGRLGYRWGLGEQQYLDLMGGIGFDFWVRSLQGEGGYNEYWFPFYLKAGLEISPRERGFIGTLGIKAPIYTTQVADLTGVGGDIVTLHPGVMPSGYSEAGYKFTKSLSLVAYFDSYWFAKSPNSLGFYQPESKSYQVGVKLGWSF